MPSHLTQRQLFNLPTYYGWGDCGGLHVHLLSNLLRRLIRQGALWVRDAERKIPVFGDRLPGPDAIADCREPFPLKSI